MLSLNYKTLGSGSPLIILHGLFGSLDNWMSHARTLSEDYSVFLIDQRNHGKSPHAESHTYGDMADDLLNFMDEQGIWRANILGHSMGGKVAMKFAAEYSDRVETLIVADMAPKAYPPHHDAIIAALTSFPLSEIGTREAAEQFLLQAGVENIGERQFLLKSLARDSENRFYWKFNLPVLVRDYDHILAEIRQPKPFRQPVLFLHGGESRYVLPEYYPAIREQFPHAEFEVIPQAGHWLHADKPTEFLAAVKKFLALNA